MLLAGCGSSEPDQAAQPTPAASSESETPSEQPSPTEEESTPASSAPAPSVAPAGATSEACSVSSEVTMGATKIGGTAYSGAVAQADVDETFTDARRAALPADAQPYYDALAEVAGELPTKTGADLQAMLNEWLTPYENWVSVNEQLCT
jgi:hypothetical protein